MSVIFYLLCIIISYEILYIYVSISIWFHPLLDTGPLPTFSILHDLWKEFGIKTLYAMYVDYFSAL